MKRREKVTGQYTAYVPDPSEIPSGLCECGCGKPTEPAKATYRYKRHFKGYPLPRLKGHGFAKKAEQSHKWKGGRSLNSYGYIAVYAPDHPRQRKGVVLEHRLVMEAHLGRILEPHEIVHHKNHDKTDNRIENLELTDRSEHSRHHCIVSGTRPPSRKGCRKVVS